MSKLSSRFAGALLIVMVTVSTSAADERRPAPLVISPQAIQAGLTVAPRAYGVPRQRTTASSHTGRRVAWTVLGAVGGFFGGAFLGSTIDRAVHDCNCDDPGFAGFLIGMPVGAVAGGVAGFVLSK